MKTPSIKNLSIPGFYEVASKLPSVGQLALSHNHLSYLNIDDDYIHQLFPLLKNHHANKPNYFGKGAIGAHITVIYPEENKIINSQDLNQTHHFIIKDMVTAEINLKTYYILLIESASLLALRRRYGLADKLCFKGYAIGFHITIGVKFR